MTASKRVENRCCSCGSGRFAEVKPHRQAEAFDRLNSCIGPTKVIEFTFASLKVIGRAHPKIYLFDKEVVRAIYASQSADGWRIDCTGHNA